MMSLKYKTIDPLEIFMMYKAAENYFSYKFSCQMGFWFCDGHQHGICIQTSINLAKTFLCISCLGKKFFDLNLGKSLSILIYFFLQILDLIY